MEVSQNFVIARGEERIIRFLVTGGSGASQADWYAGARLGVPADVHLSTGTGEISLTNSGPDCFIDIHFTSILSSSLTAGQRVHELWATIDGMSSLRATGTLTVRDTLRS